MMSVSQEFLNNKIIIHATHLNIKKYIKAPKQKALKVCRKEDIMAAIRVNLFFPDNHEIALLPKGQRAVKAKELIEFALTYQKQITQLQSDITDIKNMVSSGVIPPVPEKSKEMIDADAELIKDILGMS